jgi:alkanesulfonate monooxygenase SsuD/methylene tetrahydromethanopterin reductase-like flavin-dependent oxidoreductase (luciferase family)
VSQVHELLKEGGQEHLEAVMPDDWIDQLTITGTPEDWQAAIGRLVEAGANSVVLVPAPHQELTAFDEFPQKILA